MNEQTKNILDMAIYMSKLQSDSFNAGVEYQKQKQQKEQNNE
jgi:hypothetical protein